MKSGDLATIDSEGYCRIVGREKDTVIRGGEIIYPAEIEDFLTSQDEILEAHVFGIPDEKFGENWSHGSFLKRAPPWMRVQSRRFAVKYWPITKCRKLYDVLRMSSSMQQENHKNST